MFKNSKVYFNATSSHHGPLCFKSSKEHKKVCHFIVSELHKELGPKSTVDYSFQKEKLHLSLSLPEGRTTFMVTIPCDRNGNIL